VASGISITRNGGKLEIRWHASDAINNIGKAEYSLDGAEWKVAAPVIRLSDSPDLDYGLSLDAGPGATPSRCASKTITATRPSRR